MKFEIKKLNIAKIMLVIFASFMSFVSLSDLAEANWQCNSPRNNSNYDYLISWSPQSRAEIIRGRGAGLPTPSNWGSNCAVGCNNPSGCGNCECRCQGEDLYCADIWTTNSGRVAAQSCTWNVKSSYHNKCIPTSVLASPRNNSYYNQGSRILFSANGSSDGNGERLSYHWIIRPSSGADIKINTYSRSFYRSSLPVGDYTAYLAVRNKQGVYASPTWRSVRFSIGRSATCGTRATSYANSATTWPSGSSWCGPGFSGSSFPSFPAPNQTVSWNCLGQNGGANRTCYASRAAAPLPVVRISANPTTVKEGDNSVITWSTANASSCWGWGTREWEGWKNNRGGSQGVQPLVPGRTYSIRCWNSDGVASGVQSVRVEAISLGFSANPGTVDEGDPSTLTWTTNNVDYCWGSGTAEWRGWKEKLGSTENVHPVAPGETYNIECWKDGLVNRVRTSVSTGIYSVTIASNPPPADYCPLPGSYQTNYADCTAMLTGEGAALCSNGATPTGMVQGAGNACTWNCSTSSCSGSVTSPVTCNYDCGSPIVPNIPPCEDSDCGGTCPGNCSGNLEYVTGKQDCYLRCSDGSESVVSDNLCANLSCSSGTTVSKNCSCSNSSQDITNWIEVPAN